MSQRDLQHPHEAAHEAAHESAHEHAHEPDHAPRPAPPALPDDPVSARGQHANLSRRGLLRGLAGVGGLFAAEGLLRNTPSLGARGGFGGAPLLPLAFGQQGGRAPAPDDRYYIFCYFNGGWDILLGLDPRDPRVFSEERRRVTLIQPGYANLAGVGRDVIRASTGVTFGPHIGELARHADRLAVVRGMSMDTLTHEAGRRRFLTGKPPSGLQARGSSATTWLAAHLGAGEPIPNLALQVESFNSGDLPNYASALVVGNSDDLLRTLTPTEPALPPLVARQVSASLSDAAACDGATRSAFWRAAEEGRQKALEMTQGGFASRFDLRRPEFAELRASYGINAVNDSVEVRGALAVQAITSGMSRCVSVQVAGGLDTHFENWETDQGLNQERGFRVVARMVDDLARREYKGTGRSWLDHTVLVGFSEFSRTPLLNDAGGRDHALTNACFLLGGRVRGGAVVGRSSDVGMQPVGVDLRTGEAQPAGAGEVVRPEHVLQTLYREVGVPEARANLGVAPIAALLS